MLEECCLLYHPFPTEQQEVSLYDTSDQNSSTVFHGTSRVLTLAFKFCLCPQHHNQ